jgi:hypothetical protein
MGTLRKAAVSLGVMMLVLGAGAAPAHAEFGFVTSWPLTGAHPFASGIATDPASNVYVASANSEIQKFTADGDLITKWGSGGTGPGQFATDSVSGGSILDVAIGSGGDVYVADLWGNRVHRFTADGSFVSRWGSPGTENGEFDEPNGIATDPAGNVYVSDGGNDRVQKFDPDGAFVAKWSIGPLTVPTDVATDSAGNVYVATFMPGDSGHLIHKFTGDGVPITQWGTRGFAPGEIAGQAPDLATDPSGHVYVVENYQNPGPRPSEPFDRLQKFTSDGDFVSAFGCHGSGDVNFLDPGGVATDAAGNVYVGDGSRIHKLGDPGTAADCGLVIDARARHRQKLKRLRVFAGCPEEECELTTEGRAEAARDGDVKRARLRADDVTLAAGEEATIRLRFTDRRHRRKIGRAVREGSVKRAKVFVSVRGEDAHGITARRNLTFRLKR